MTLETEFKMASLPAKIFQLERELEQKGKIEISNELRGRYSSLKADYILNMENLIRFYEGRIK